MPIPVEIYMSQIKLNTSIAWSVWVRNSKIRPSSFASHAHFLHEDLARVVLVLEIIFEDV